MSNGRSLHPVQRGLESCPKTAQVGVIPLPIDRHFKPDHSARGLGLCISQNRNDRDLVSSVEMADQPINCFECLLQGLALNASTDIRQDDYMTRLLPTAANKTCG